MFETSLNKKDHVRHNSGNRLQSLEPVWSKSTKRRGEVGQSLETILRQAGANPNKCRSTSHPSARKQRVSQHKSGTNPAQVQNKRRGSFDKSRTSVDTRRGDRTIRQRLKQSLTRHIRRGRTRKETETRPRQKAQVGLKCLMQNQQRSAVLTAPRRHSYGG